jgi:hypothetical protein
MPSVNAFEINGVVDTNQSVLQNINTLCTASGCWLTYDITTGLWSVIINRTGTSVKSFDDSNIIGGINVSGSGITEAYNKISIDFPHKSLRDQRDYIDLVIPEADRFPNELENTMTMSLDCINDPVQAQYIATVELKQTRVDKIIEFRTDYTSLGLRAGDLIDVTAEAYDWTDKIFRITRVVEDDLDDGTIQVSITALEYDANVYDTTGLIREERKKKTGIVPKSANSNLKSLDNQAGLPLDLTSIAKALGLLLTFNTLTGRWELSQGGKQINLSANTLFITWTFDTGSDLDIRCRFISPNVGQSTIQQCLGYTGTGTSYIYAPNNASVASYYSDSVSAWGASGAVTGIPTGTEWMVWGGDNTGVGQEQVLVNLDSVRAAYPSTRYIIIECRGNWFTTRGWTPVYLTADLFVGGTNSGPSSYVFSNAGYSNRRLLDGVSIYVDSFHGSATELDGYNGATAPGDLMGYFVFDTETNTSQFRNDLTGLV